MKPSNLDGYLHETNDSFELASSLLKGLRLPPQPTVVMAISKEMAVPEPNIRKIGGLLEKDPAMASRVLQTINSPLFGMKRPVASIRTGLNLLGLRNFYSMIVTSAAREALGFRGREMEDLWAHCLQVAKVCEQIAQKVPDVAPEEAYLVGLFHDSAIPLLVKKFAEYGEIVNRVIAIGGDIVTIEEEKFNTHHALVGAVLARSWNLPSHIFKAIRFHHGDSLNLFGDAKTRNLGGVLMLSDYLARCICTRGETEDCRSPRWLALIEEIKAQLNIQEETIQSFRDEAAKFAA